MEFESNENAKEVEELAENEIQEIKANAKQKKWQLNDLETLRKAYWIARKHNIPAYKVALKLLPDRTHEAIAHKFKDKKTVKFIQEYNPIRQEIGEYNLFMQDQKSTESNIQNQYSYYVKVLPETSTSTSVQEIKPLTEKYLYDILSNCKMDHSNCFSVNNDILFEDIQRERKRRCIELEKYITDDQRQKNESHNFSKDGPERNNRRIQNSVAKKKKLNEVHTVIGLRCYNCVERHKYCSREKPKCKECLWKDLNCNYRQVK